MSSASSKRTLGRRERIHAVVGIVAPPVQRRSPTPSPRRRRRVTAERGVGTSLHRPLLPACDASARRASRRRLTHNNMSLSASVCGLCPCLRHRAAPLAPPRSDARVAQSSWTRPLSDRPPCRRWDRGARRRLCDGHCAHPRLRHHRLCVRRAGAVSTCAAGSRAASAADDLGHRSRRAGARARAQVWRWPCR